MQHDLASRHHLATESLPLYARHDPAPARRNLQPSDAMLAFLAGVALPAGYQFARGLTVLLG